MVKTTTLERGFNTKEKAAKAYDKAARQHRGADAGCNFSSSKEADAAASLALGEWKRQQPRPLSGFYGVSARGGRWKAKLRYEGKHRSLGCFNTKKEAAAAYDASARQHRGVGGV